MIYLRPNGLITQIRKATLLQNGLSFILLAKFKSPKL